MSKSGHSAFRPPPPQVSPTANASAPAEASTTSTATASAPNPYAGAPPGTNPFLPYPTNNPNMPMPYQPYTPMPTGFNPYGGYPQQPQQPGYYPPPGMLTTLGYLQPFSLQNLPIVS